MSRIVRSFTGLVYLGVCLSLTAPAHAQDAVAEILSPRTGEAIRGAVTVLGTATAPNFERYKIEYASQQTDAVVWVLIGEVTQQVSDGPLAQWDTAALDDGLYQIRLRLILRDGAVVQTVVTGLIVQNNVPTPLPVATLVADASPTILPTDGATLTPVVVQPPTDAPRATDLPTETPLPTAVVLSADSNPALGNVSSGSLFSASIEACWGGVQLALIGFIIYGVYTIGAWQLRKLRNSPPRRE